MGVLVSVSPLEVTDLQQMVGSRTVPKRETHRQLTGRRLHRAS
uniref:Uncharacterized protein n=1 Tax=Peronospora matthiolae TaxID=2874970 RepID=A0AAV1UIQ2_9STRA